MKYLLTFLLLFGMSTTALAEDGYPDDYEEEVFEEEKEIDLVPKKVIEYKDKDGEMTLPKSNTPIRITVFGQGVAPAFVSNSAQALALSKRAAMVDGYRLIAERINGVRIEGQDTIKNMMVQKSNVRADVRAMIRNAKVVETTFLDGMCEVEMEIEISYSQFDKQ